MKIIKNKIQNCYKLKFDMIHDKRGAFTKIFSQKIFNKFKIKKIRQINICTFKKKNTLRGFHYQIEPKEEFKLVFCVSGGCNIHILDTRKKSKTYKKNQTIKLSQNDNYAVLVPKGCANAFQSLKNNSSVVYFSTNEYYPNYEKKIHYKDNFVKIKFPKNMILSDKDS